MAKALLGHRVMRDDRLLRETARLRSRVRDLEQVIQDLLADNDRLRADHVDSLPLDVPQTPPPAA